MKALSYIKNGNMQIIRRTEFTVNTEVVDQVKERQSKVIVVRLNP